jgi:Sulfotransferase family
MTNMPIADASSGARREPLFILAPARSHSTVSIALLAGHPGIYGFPELRLFGGPPARRTVGAILEYSALPGNKISYELGGVLRTIADLHDGCQEPSAIDRASAWLGEHGGWTTVELMNYLLDTVAPRMGLEKSPETVTSDERLDACLSAFPNARYLHLTRHPVTTQRSMQAFWGEWFGWDRKTQVVRSASAWYLPHCRVARALGQLPNHQWMRIRSEDLLRDPQAQLPRVLGWLGLPCDDGITARMTRTQDWRFAGPRGAIYGGDPKFMNAPTLRCPPAPVTVAFDPSWGLPAEMCRRMTALADYLGY